MTAATDRFDVIIVGARCAGAATAAHLAQAGVKVALLEASPLPSGQPSSTHLIQPPGMAELDRLGIAEAVRAQTPPLVRMRLAFDGHEAQLAYGEGQAAHC